MSTRGSTYQHGRGGGTGRSRGRGGKHHSARQPPGAPPLGPRICEIDLPAPQANSLTTAIIEDTIAVASYSWLKHHGGNATPSIVVPGFPPIWRQPSLPVQLERGIWHQDDDALYLRGQNLVTLVASIQHLQPNYNFPAIDAVFDRNTLRRLLRWANGQKDDFRADIQLAGNTVLFSRCPPIVRTNDGGVSAGISFEHRFTRAIREFEVSAILMGIMSQAADEHEQRFAGMKLLVRYELDCVLPPPADPTSNRQNAAATPPRATVRYAGILDVVTGGSLVEQSRTVEMKSHTSPPKASAHKETLFQLLLSQTPHLVRGMVDEQCRVSDEPRWETTEQLDASLPGERERQLERLSAALVTIVATARLHGQSRLLSIVAENRVLTLYARATGPLLPAEMLSLFCLAV